MASLPSNGTNHYPRGSMPVTGKKPGDMTEFDDPYLVNATLQACQ